MMSIVDDLFIKVKDSLDLGQVVFLKATSPTGYVFVCWVYLDSSPYSSRVQCLYTEKGTDFALTNTQSWSGMSVFLDWLTKRDVQWLEPDELSSLLQNGSASRTKHLDVEHKLIYINRPQ